MLSPNAAEPAFRWVGGGFQISRQNVPPIGKGGRGLPGLLCTFVFSGLYQVQNAQLLLEGPNWDPVFQTSDSDTEESSQQEGESSHESCMYYVLSHLPLVSVFVLSLNFAVTIFVFSCRFFKSAKLLALAFSVSDF
jgi:hypothetical protein